MAGADEEEMVTRSSFTFSKVLSWTRADHKKKTSKDQIHPNPHRGPPQVAAVRVTPLRTQVAEASPPLCLPLAPCVDALQPASSPTAGARVI